MKVVENLSHLFYFIAIIGITPSNLSSPSGGRTFSPIADTPRHNPGEDVRNDKYFELSLKEGYIYSKGRTGIGFSKKINKSNK